MKNNQSLTQKLNIRKKKSKIKKYLGIIFVIIGLTIFILFCIGTLRINVNPFIALGSATLGVLLGAVGGVIIYGSRENLVIYISNCCKKQLQKLYPQFSFSCNPIATEILRECQLFHPKVNHNLDEDDEYAWLLHGKIQGKDIILSQVRCGDMTLYNGGWTGPIFFELYLQQESLFLSWHLHQHGESNLHLRNYYCGRKLLIPCSHQTNNMDIILRSIQMN